MIYLTSSVREAYSMSKRGLITQLQQHPTYKGIGETFKGWTHDELVNAWLEKFGTKEQAALTDCRLCGSGIAVNGLCHSCREELPDFETNGQVPPTN